MKLTPKFKKPAKIPTRSEKLFLLIKPETNKNLLKLIDYSGYNKTFIVETLINFCFDEFTDSIDIKAPAMIGNKNFINQNKINKMTTKPQTHLFNPDGSPVSEKLIFTNFSTYQKSFFDTIEEAEQQIKAGAVTGFIYDEKTRRQRFYTNGILSNEKQL